MKVTECDYCGNFALCTNDLHGGTVCSICKEEHEKEGW